MSGLITTNDLAKLQKKGEGQDAMTQEELRNSAPTEKQLAWLHVLMTERGFDPAEHADPTTRADCQQAINDLLAQPAVAATQEQMDEIDRLAKQLGVTIVNDGDWDASRAGRILYSMRRRVAKANTASGSFVERLKAEAAAKGIEVQATFDDAYTDADRARDQAEVHEVATAGRSDD